MRLKGKVALVTGACHGADIVLGSMGSRAGWEETVEGLKNRGAYGSGEEFKIVVDYLALYFGNEIKLNAAKPEDLKKELTLTAIPELKDASLELLKTRIKFADKKPAGVK